MTTKDILTDRLILRSTREEDGPFCLSIWLDDKMGKYLSDPPREKADEDELNFAQGIETQEGWYPFVAVAKGAGDLVGTCSAVPSDDLKQWDLGYCVHKKYWRQGCHGNDPGVDRFRISKRRPDIHRPCCAGKCRFQCGAKEAWLCNRKRGYVSQTEHRDCLRRIHL